MFSYLNTYGFFQNMIWGEIFIICSDQSCISVQIALNLVCDPNSCLFVSFVTDCLIIET